MAVAGMQLQSGIWPVVAHAVADVTRRADGPSMKDLAGVDRDGLDPVRQRMYAQREARMAEYSAQREEWFTRRAAESRERADRNRELAAEVRRRFLRGAR